jgi:hypothetical protein
MIPLTRALFISVVVSLGFSSCALVLGAFDTDVTKDPRFRNVVGHEIRTKQTLYLYAPDNRRPEKIRHIYDLVETKGYNEVLTAVVPAGHPVRFDKVLRKNGIESTSEDMYGEITIKGNTYPISYFLGTSLFHDGWRRMFDAFAIQE